MAGRRCALIRSKIILRLLKISAEASPLIAPAPASAAASRAAGISGGRRLDARESEPACTRVVLELRMCSGVAIVLSTSAAFRRAGGAALIDLLALAVEFRGKDRGAVILPSCLQVSARSLGRAYPRSRPALGSGWWRAARPARRHVPPRQSHRRRPDEFGRSSSELQACKPIAGTSIQGFAPRAALWASLSRSAAWGGAVARCRKQVPKA